ncbi:MAG: hypothetical protein WC280_00520 [Patescibacteria group bacterium]
MINQNDLNFKRHRISDEDNSFKIEEKRSRERREDEMEKDLLEIYTDDKGVISDLSKIKVKKRRPFIFNFFIYLFFLIAISLSAYWFFSYFKSQSESSFVLNVEILAPTRLVAGEEFFYEVDYANNSRNSLKNVEINIKYPDNFVYLESYPSPNFNNNFFTFSDLGSGEGGKIKIRGYIMNKEGVNNLLSLNAGYEVSGFSSFFKKDFYYSNVVNSHSFDLSLDLFSTILSGEDYKLNFSFKNFNKLINKDVAIYFSSSENIVFEPNLSKEFVDLGFSLTEIEDNVFKINYENNKGDDFVFDGDVIIGFKYKANDRISDSELVTWGLRYLEDDLNLDFYERLFTLNIIKSNLHLSMVVNNNNTDQTVNFGEVLECVINYENKGDKEMVDLIIMAVLESDFLDWGSIVDDNEGKVSRKTISWTSQEVSRLKSLSPGDSGQIKFSIKVSDFEDSFIGKNLGVKTYSQFSMGNISEVESEDFKESDSKSNLIEIKINSDFTAREEIRYFNEDNIPVGSGPLPPVIGEKSNFKVYWIMENSLHELRDVKAELYLPDYVMWADNSNVSAGNIYYDLVDHKVVWNLDRLPTSINNVDVSFDISIIPTDFEYNKILILSTGSSFEARDLETGAIINKKTGIKTSKLEDDPIANLSSDGRIR